MYTRNTNTQSLLRAIVKKNAHTATFYRFSDFLYAIDSAQHNYSMHWPLNTQIICYTHCNSGTNISLFLLLLLLLCVSRAAICCSVLWMLIFRLALIFPHFSVRKLDDVEISGLPISSSILIYRKLCLQWILFLVGRSWLYGGLVPNHFNALHTFVIKSYRYGDDRMIHHVRLNAKLCNVYYW